VWQKRPHFITGFPPLVLHDSACCHVARPVQDLLARWQWETVEHPPYSPDMSPCDFDLFPKMKESLQGKRFHSVEEVMQAVGRSLATVNRNYPLMASIASRRFGTR
jgi:histone-lysine N-methyltransferase SETMAR